jgi:hypothetical protein
MSLAFVELKRYCSPLHKIAFASLKTGTGLMMTSAVLDRILVHPPEENVISQ